MSRRFGVSKGQSASKFRRHVQHTKAPNIQRVIMRGGYRL